MVLTVNSIAPWASLQDIPVHKCKTDIWTGPALPEMKYTTINPHVYISSVLASRCLLCSDWAPVVTWLTALCLKPPCEDLLRWHTTHHGGIFEAGAELRRKLGKVGKLIHCFETEAFGRRTRAGSWQKNSFERNTASFPNEILHLIKVTSWYFLKG